MPRRLDLGTWVSVIVALLLWASAFAGIKAGLKGFGPGELALLRFGTASFVLIVYASVTRMRLPDLADVPRIGLAGALGITLYHVCLNFGEMTVTAGAASLIIASGPIFTALLAMVFLRERLTLWGWGGIIVAFSGVALITLGEGSGGLTFEPAAMLVLVAAISTASYFVVSKPLLDKYTPLEFTSYSIWLGTLPMLVFLPGLLTQLPEAPLSATIAVVYLGVFPGAIAYALYSHVLSKLPASIASSFLYVQPVSATIIAWFWIREVPSLVTLAGGAVALLGVALVSTRGRVSER
ncbi:MAG: DMT family transporter [Actinobacteria bacterium]|nr:MAG: DMT family transporter [Actinomycetota bacterium]